MATIAYNPTAFNPASGTGGYAPPPTYNYAPSPQGGNGIFGAVPGNVQPPNPFKALSAVYPNLTQTNSQLSGDIMSNLMGEVSPNTIAALHDAANKFGVNGPLNISPLSLGETDTQLENLGLSEYNPSIKTVSGNETLSPLVQAQIAELNAQNNAAPDPNAAGALSAVGSVIGLIAQLV